MDKLYTNTGMLNMIATNAAAFKLPPLVKPSAVAKSMKRKSRSTRPNMKRKPPMKTAIRL
eukprot:CAMPEP_0178614224 /NCGR_PEP_ID=MMETSP0698-20121128/2052_1 /TAXON_ID=265572 /ORGANISM="Extubocellulus spinifer, Strain CCMP396" /LENGTH=59 /DNA_ID=CAMNT_0020252949 /DNA_START=158 /DNA_END=337 /DNA_ORIENTATION=-